MRPSQGNMHLPVPFLFTLFLSCLLGIGLKPQAIELLVCLKYLIYVFAGLFSKPIALPEKLRRKCLVLIKMLKNLGVASEPSLC